MRKMFERLVLVAMTAGLASGTTGLASEGDARPTPTARLVVSPDDFQALEWAKQAALAPFALNFQDFPQQLSKAKADFTEKGWKSAEAIATESVDAVRAQRLLCRAEPSPGASVDKVSTDGGAVYRVEIPIAQFCETPHTVSRRNLRIRALVIRANSQDRPKGLAIDEFSASPL